MTTIINARAQQDAKPEPGGQTFGCLVAAGLIIFGAWFGATKTLEYAHGALRDQAAIDQAEMEFLHRRMDCLPGETLVIVPLPGGAKSVKCAPAHRRQLEGGARG